MNEKKKFKQNIWLIPLYILLITACMKWLIEGILDIALLEVAFLSAALGIAVLYKNLKIYKMGLPWLLYMVNILLSLLIHDSTFGLWGRGLVTVLITAFVLVIDSPVLSYHSIVKFLSFLGVGTGMLVIMHYILGDTFNRLYFPLLNSVERGTAELYVRHGYYFGVLYSPHESAGLISFAIASLILWKLISKSRKSVCYIGALILFFPLLLTGKKGILACLVISLVIIIAMLYVSKKQWGKILGFVGIIVLLLTAFIMIAIKNPQIEIFNRFNQFFSLLAAGATADSGRAQLYELAFNEWKENPVFGIGWRHFNALTTTKYGLTQSHEVNCDYLQWLCETGSVGFVLSIIPVVIMLRRAIYIGKKLVKNREDVKETWILAFAVFIQIYTVIYAFIEIPFFDIVYSSVYFLSCVIINSAYGRRKNNHE